jgi:hypothetical protein
MGFYHPDECLEHASADLAPVITPLEYTVLLSRATRTVLGTETLTSDTCGPGSGALPAAAPHALLPALLARVSRCPDDVSARRLLGATLLRAGDPRGGLMHLTIALNRLLRDMASAGSLHQTLCLQLEMALLLIVLAPISARLGGHDLVRRVMTDVLRR